MGAAGRDFHNFNVVFRDDLRYEVVAFTAAQIPNIAGRQYPAMLAGPRYPKGIAIFPEDDLESLIKVHGVDQVVFAYSDVSHADVMHRACRAIAHGADFRFLGARTTMLPSCKPVVSICAVRTGAGKSLATRRIAALLRYEGIRVVILRHPMPYGDLTKQAVLRFATIADLARADCTIEEMEEYEPHIRQGHIVYAGVDYERILRMAEREADVILWDGGNNDLPFVKPDLEIVLVDPHRPGHEVAYFPGEANVLRADVLVITKVDTAVAEDVEAVRRTISAQNPRATVTAAAMPISVANQEAIRGKRVLVIEDGPTVTHGSMPFGAGVLAARRFGAAELIDPRPYAVGSIRRTFSDYPHIGPLLPAMGYGRQQMKDLEDTIDRVDCDAVLIATPADLGRVIRIRAPMVRVTYEFEERDGRLREALQPIIERAKSMVTIGIYSSDLRIG
jgi:predicted GTPase